MKKKILFVDDAQIFLHLEETLFSRDSFSTITAVSGLEALKAAREHRPDLVLLDLHLPDLEGDKVCRHLKEDPLTRNIPVVILTCDSTNDARSLCLSAGCEDFLTKPVKRETLIEVVARILKINLRRFYRMSTRLHCTLSVRGSDLPAHLVNLSSGGAFIESANPPRPGEKVTLTLLFPGSTEITRLPAAVRWVRSRQPGLSDAMGVEFEGIGERERRALETQLGLEGLQGPIN